MREAEEVERLGLSFPALLPVRGCERSKLEQARLLRVQFEPKLPKPLGEFRPEPLGIRFSLESNHDVVGVTHDDHIAMRPLLTPCLNL
jgi:hypothetical protein